MRGLYQRDDGNYYVRIPTGEKGKYERVSLKTNDKAEAERKASSMLATHKAGRDIHCLWQDLVETYKSEHFKHLKPGTRQTYKWAIIALSRAGLYDKVVRDIDSAIIDSVVRTRFAEGISSGGVRSELAVLSSIMSKAEGWHLIDRNPVQRYLKANSLKVKRGAPRVRWLTKGEEETVLSLLDAWIAAGSEDHKGRLTLKRAVIVAIDTGLRLAELCNMRWADINFERSNVHVRKEVAKSKEDRWVPLLPRVLALLRQMQEEKDGDWVFPALTGGPRSNFDKSLRHFAGTAVIRPKRKGSRPNRFVDGPVIKAGLEPFSWHDLRRTCGCRLLQEHGLSMEQVSKWLGHKSVSVTERHYAFLTVDNLHKALENARQRDTKSSTLRAKRIKRRRWLRR